ncbi:type VI secretion system contractile sheath large subunit, partial [Acinetobacter bohemicus]
AASAHAPFISAASPSMFGLESFTDIDRPRDVSKIFETAEYVQWRSFRESEDARYVALTIPHVLGRLPYHPREGTVTEGFN